MDIEISDVASTWDRPDTAICQLKYGAATEDVSIHITVWPCVTAEFFLKRIVKINKTNVK